MSALIRRKILRALIYVNTTVYLPVAVISQASLGSTRSASEESTASALIGITSSSAPKAE